VTTTADEKELPRHAERFFEKEQVGLNFMSLI